MKKKVDWQKRAKFYLKQSRLFDAQNDKLRLALAIAIDCWEYNLRQIDERAYRRCKAALEARRVGKDE